VQVTVGEPQWGRDLKRKLAARLSADPIQWIEVADADAQLASSLDRKAWKVLLG